MRERQSLLTARTPGPLGSEHRREQGRGHRTATRNLSEYRDRSYSHLVALLNQQETSELQGTSGIPYQVEVQAVWDDKAGGNLRVLGSIDDGGVRAFRPLTVSFILRPNGTFVDE